MRITRRFVYAFAAAIALAGCSELSQEGPKPFVAKDEVRSQATALSGRVATQDEYPAMQDGGRQALQGRTRTASSLSQ